VSRSDGQGAGCDDPGETAEDEAAIDDHEQLLDIFARSGRARAFSLACAPTPD
jgi:hypothetical protein